MTGPDEPAGRTAAAPDTESGTRNGHVAPGLSEELARMLALLRTKGALTMARVKLAAERAVWVSVTLFWAGLAFLVATVIAVAALFRGVTGAIDSLTQTSWAGDLTAGVLFFGGVSAALVIVTARRRRAQLRRLQERFGP